MITLAGIPLPLPTPTVAEWIASNIDPRDVLQFDGTAWNHNMFHLAPCGSIQPPPIRLGSLFWPSGASRFAVGYFLASDEQMDVLRPVGITPSGPAPIPLVMDDATVVGGATPNRITATVYMLPPRPVQDRDQTGGNGLWLVTVVDQRYFWQFRGADIVVNVGTDTYSTLISQILTAIGVTATVDTPSTNYGKPSNRFTVRRQSLPILLDAVAFYCGLRVSVTLAGAVSVTSYNTDAEFEFDSAADVTPAGPFLPVAGGRFEGSDLADIVPAQVETTFGSLASDGATYSTVPVVVDTFLTALSLPQFAGVSGFAGKKVLTGDLTGTMSANASIAASPTGATESVNVVTITTTAAHAFAVGQTVTIAGVAVTSYNGTFVVTGTPTGTSFTYTNPASGLAGSGSGTVSSSQPSNVVALMAYAQQQATDWYLWQLGYQDQQMARMVPWTPTGLTDTIEWHYSTTGSFTRVMRTRFNQMDWGRFRRSENEGEQSWILATAPPLNNLTVDLVGGTPSFSNITLIDMNATQFTITQTVAGQVAISLTNAGGAITFKDDKMGSVSSQTYILNNSTVTNVGGAANFVIDSASVSASGIVNLSTQTLGTGDKAMNQSLTVNLSASTSKQLLVNNNLTHQLLAIGGGSSTHKILGDVASTKVIYTAEAVDSSLLNVKVTVNGYVRSVSDIITDHIDLSGFEGDVYRVLGGSGVMAITSGDFPGSDPAMIVQQLAGGSLGGCSVSMIPGAAASHQPYLFLDSPADGGTREHTTGSVILYNGILFNVAGTQSEGVLMLITDTSNTESPEAGGALGIAHSAVFCCAAGTLIPNIPLAPFSTRNFPIFAIQSANGGIGSRYGKWTDNGTAINPFFQISGGIITGVTSAGVGSAAIGDIFYIATDGNIRRLAIGGLGQVLTVVASGLNLIPAWV